jgi:pimeloyl-ACP methyl ester carboxylesterase
MIRSLTFAALAALSSTSAVAAGRARPAPAQAPTVILVHGAFADGSSWRKVIARLQARGVAAVAVHAPLTSLQDDVAATRRAIAAAPGQVVLVGHSWGGTVITEAGDDPKVAALVYVAAFAPDVGQSSADQGEGFPPAPGLARLEQRDGFLSLPEPAVREDFAQDLAPAEARLIHATQGPLKASALDERVSHAAWRGRPSEYVLSRRDRMLSPQLQAATAERIGARLRPLAAGHASMLSQPAAVAAAILEAAGRPAANGEGR